MNTLVTICLIAICVRSQMIAETVIASNCDEVLNQRPRNGTIF
jgi:hypothetical protein